jgi:hypothetical protein
MGATAMAVPSGITKIIANPNQLFTQQYRKNAWFNAKKLPKNFWKGLTSGFRKNNDYEWAKEEVVAKSWSPASTKNILKRGAWLVGKPIRGVANLASTVLNAGQETFKGIRNKKFTWNPKTWFT